MSAMIGQPGPRFALSAISSGREVGPDTCRGAPCMLLFHNHHTLAAVSAVQAAVRATHQVADRPILASVLDLSSVPRVMRKLATSGMQNGYRQAAQQLPSGLLPVDYIIILPDWDGSVTRAFQWQNVDKQPALVLLDEAWIVRDRYQGDDPGSAAQRLLREHGIAPGNLTGFPPADEANSQRP